MNVVAVRDDGALLVTLGGQAAAIVLDDNASLTTRGAALARGDWSDDVIGVGVPTDIDLRRRLRARLKALDEELDAATETLPSKLRGES